MEAGVHSFEMAQNILKAALAEAGKYGGKRIETICVEVGERDFHEADSLQFCLEALAKGTVAQGARMEIELVDATAMPTGNDSLSITLRLG